MVFWFSLGRASDPLKGIYGAGAHSDYGLITLLATDDVLGLQVWIRLDCFWIVLDNKILLYYEVGVVHLFQICKDKDAKPQIWEYVAPLKGWVWWDTLPLSVDSNILGIHKDQFMELGFIYLSRAEVYV